MLVKCLSTTSLNFKVFDLCGFFSLDRERTDANKDENDSSDSDEALGEDEFPPVHRPKPLPPQEDIRMDVDQGDSKSHSS